MLYHQRVGEGPRIAILIHGIMGSSRNLLTIARMIAQRFPAWSILLPDLRHHGKSGYFDPPNTVQACAQDILDLNIQADMLIGHSFGGKVALCLNELAPVKQVWVWDAEPGLILPEHTYKTVQKLKTIALPLSDRQAAGQAILKTGLSPEIAAWMTTNLREVKEGLVWKFDLDIILELLDSFGNTQIKPRENTDFIKAECSPHMVFESPRVHVLQNAGHWVHIDNPKGVLDIMSFDFN